MHPNASMKYNRRYKDFNEFCEYIKTPEEVMNWYKVNKIKWNKPVETGEYNKKPMCWPDDIIRDKIGNCFDHALFMHYFCERYNIENYIVRCVRYKALRVNSKYYFAHHFVCVLKSDIGWVIFDYNSSYENTPRAIKAEQTSVLRGPFETKEDAGEEYTKEFNERLEKFYKENLFDWKYRDRTRSQSIFLNDNVMRMLDKLYGEHSFTQEDFYYMMRHEMGDTKYEGEYYESINVLDYIGNKLILGLDKVQNFREEGDISIQEAKLKADERTDYGLPKKKKYPMPDEAHVLQAIRMFNHCDPEDEAELARNIKKYMKKYNMKDVKVGKNNRFSKYYHTKTINEEVRMWGYEIRAMVNESLRLLEMSGGGGPMIGMEINDQSVQYSSPGQFIITTKDKDSGVDYGITSDIKAKYLYRKDKDKGYVKEDMESYLKDKDYKIYQYTGDIDIWKYMLNDIYYNSYDEDTTIYEDLTGRKQLTDDQIDFDENFRYYNIKQVLLESSILNATTKSKLDELKGKKTHLFDIDIKVSDKFSVAESIEGYCLRYGDYHSDFVSLDELTKIYNV